MPADYYELLQIDAGASDAELRRAWRLLAARWHPDRAGIAATATFQQLSAAYTTLSDPIKRAAYDHRRKAARPKPEPSSAPAPTATPEPTAGSRQVPGVMLTRLCGPLNSLAACGVVRFDEPGFIHLVLSEAEAAHGGMAYISLPVDLWCPACRGDPAAACSRCNGRRTVEELYSAWLAIPPGIAPGDTLTPSVDLPNMVEPVRFRVVPSEPR